MSSFQDVLPAPARKVQFTGLAAETLETGRLRLFLTAVMFALAFAAVAARLVDVAVLGAGSGPSLAAAAGSLSGASRADITDRNGIVLAASLPTASLYADASVVPDPEAAAAQLASVVDDIDIDRVVERLSTGRRFVWLHRHLTPTEQYRVNRLGIPGLGFESEERRFYPLGALTAHVVGFTDVDGVGLAGVERSFDDTLDQGAGPLELSLDVRVQEIVRDEVEAAMAEFRAIGGAGLVMDANTGEVLAMVSLPDFNPYHPGTADDDRRFNRTTLGVYEMGSTFKIFTMAMALDSGVTSLSGGFDATHPIRVGRFTIRDFHPQARWLTVPEIFRYSSNIGSVHMAMAVGTDRQRDYLGRLGLLDPTPIELPEVGAPLVPDPWREINTMTIGFGHGLSVSPMQLASAVSASVNGGVYVPPTLIRRDPSADLPGTPVLSSTTSDILRRLMRLVVEEGTGRQADAEGYLIGGKTGTAEKAQRHGYSSTALLSSFVAAFPMNDPRYVIFVMLDEPRGNESTHGYATGGWVAAPVVGRIVERMAPMLGMAPVDPEQPEILEALDLNLAPGANQVASAAP